MSSNDLVERHIRTKRKIRTIVTYADNNSFLRKEHEEVVRFLRSHSYPSLFAKAYIPHRGIYENAKAHLYNDVFLKLDIANFFESINHKKLQTQLFIELNKVSDEPISREHCRSIVSICSCGYPGLPLGLVSSPDLANLYLKGFDSLFYAKIKSYGLENPIYTRYADDLIISCKYLDDYRTIFNKIKRDAQKLLKEFYLKLNESKTTITNLNISNHVKITGVNVIKKEGNYRHITVGRRLKDELFWKAIHYYDNPDSASELDVARLKGMVSFVLSVEKEGFSFTYSRGMRQLIYDRGYRNLPDFVSHLPNEVSQMDTGETWAGGTFCDISIENAAFDCDAEELTADIEVENTSSSEIKVCFTPAVRSVDGRTEWITNQDDYLILSPGDDICYQLEIRDSDLDKLYLVPSSANHPYDNRLTCGEFILKIRVIVEKAGLREQAFWSINESSIDILNEDAYADGDDEPLQPKYSDENILYIYKGMIRCHRDRHTIIQSTAILHDRYDNEIELNVEYCTQCRKYLLEYSLFERYRERYGILIGNIRMVTNGNFDADYDLALESPLHLSGYNVGQKDNYSSKERHYILARIVHDGIMSKGDVIKYLSYFIRMNGARRGMELAVSKWEEDISFVQMYNIAIQPRTFITDIRKY